MNRRFPLANENSLSIDDININDSDDQLYHQFLRGDVSSYDQLMIRYGDHLTFYLHGYLHNWEDAEDLMVEAFARIMVKKPRIHEGGFKAYLYKTARNLATRLYQKNNRAEIFNLDGMEAKIASGISPEDSFQNKERKRILHLCMERIEPELREALWLVYFEDLSYQDAAAVMGISRKRVDRLLQKGKKILRAELEKEGITDAHE